MKELSGRILGIDYGRRRIGVAISDPMGTIATGLPTIAYQSLPDAITRLENIILEYHVGAVVVGFPLTLKGEEGRAAFATKAFVEILQSKVAVPVDVWDERFTSVIARRCLHEMGKSPDRNKARV
ncbi:MAG TPA: Holliday junction resolvase RuvX, partial [bacterium]